MAKKQTDRFSQFLVIGIVSAVALAVLAVLVYSNRPRPADEGHLQHLKELPRGVDPLSGLPYIGDLDAPVVMVVYEDMGCPNCRNFYLSVEQNVIEEYVVSGDVKIEVYTLAFVNQQSLPAAQGTACALDQDYFWEYRDVVFNNQGVRPFNRENLIIFAEEVGLDVDTFKECLDFGIHTSDIIASSQSAYDFGVTGTPTTVINGVRHVGFIPFDQEEPAGISQLLDEAIAENK